MIREILTWRGIAVACAASALIGFGAGWSLRDLIADRAEARRDAREAEERAKAAEINLRRVNVANEISDQIGQRSAERQVIIRNTTNEIIREVPRYVTVEADRGCDVPYGFVRLHDAAATGAAPAVPGASAPSNDASSGLALSAVAGTVADNYGQCRADQERLLSLQAWIRDQAARWNTP